MIVSVSVVIVAADVAGQPRELDFLPIGLEDGIMDHLAASWVGRMGSVGVQLGVTFLVARGAFFLQDTAAAVAETGAQFVLNLATRAPIGEFARGHRNERAPVAVDDLQIMDDETTVERDRGEAIQTRLGVFH